MFKKDGIYIKVQSKEQLAEMFYNQSKAELPLEVYLNGSMDFMLIDNPETVNVKENTYVRLNLNNKTIDKEFLIEILSRSKVHLCFTKANGEEREMIATRMLNLIPKEYRPKHTGKTPVNYNVPVFDLQKEGWRSFNIDDLIFFIEK